MVLRRLKSLFKRRAELKRRVEFEKRFPLPPDLNRKLEEIARENVEDPVGTAGWQKQRFLLNLISKEGLKQTVEIGVYRGTSFFPQAIGVDVNKGIAIGIDPYSAQEAVQQENMDIIRRWVGEDFADRVDWEGIYRQLLQRLERYNLSHCTKIIRMSSADAADQIPQSIDLLHIDGNHDSEPVARDLRLYLPKVRPGRFLVMDDINFGTIQPLYHELKASMEAVYEWKPPGRDIPFWGALRKPE